MKIKLKRAWFSSTATRTVNEIQSVSGRLFKRGVHEVSDELRPFLPSTAEILEDARPPEKKPEPTLKDADIDRAAEEIDSDGVKASAKPRKAAK